MWEVVGIKIERNEPATFLLCLCTETSEKVIFGQNTPYPKNFQRENFSGLVSTESLRTQDSENIFGLGDRASVLKFKRLKVRL